jgi:hypothetical protein
MLSPKPVGRDAAARKYDIISALGAYALAGDKHDHRLVLRFLTLMTARYNWARNELAVGQREIARLWSVDERTVKREMAKLRGCGWLVVKRQGARGRVTEYGIDLEAVLETTRAHWPNVGPDFDLRMQGAPEPSRVVPMPVRGIAPTPPRSGSSEWDLAQTVLHAEDAGVYGSWLHNLSRQDRAGGRLTLKAPSRFHGAYVQTHLAARVLAAVQAVDGDVSEVVITA